ncbi:MAG: sugar transferase [Deltaproteobacteria bacterium]|nr:sugar transferase [Deltaproteobacteria bacterium]
MKLRHTKFKYVFLAIDIVILTVSFFMSLRIIMPDFWSISSEKYLFCLHYIAFCLLLVTIYIFCFRFNNLYKRKTVTTRYRHFVLILKALFGGTIVIVLLMILTNFEYFKLYGKDLIANIFIFNLVLFMIFRACFSKNIYKFLAEKKISLIKVLIVGGDKAGKYVAKELQHDPFADFEIVGFLDDYKEKGEKIIGQFNNMGNLSDLDTIVHKHDVDEILIAIDHAPYDRLIRIVETCLQTERSVKIYSDLLHVIDEKMDVEHYSSIPVISLTQKPLNAPDWDEKRILDIVLSSITLMILSPMFLAVAVGIKLSSKGPVIFKQKRFGKNGRPFDFYKFRSMHVRNSDSRHKHYVQNFIKKNGRCETDDIKVFKITDDPRVFKFGKFIRKTSIDEFPQFFNVIKGDMSLVGPRPCLGYEWECYEDWHKNRLNILPGCTGLWQALGRSSVTFEEMVILDLYYISNMTLWMDLKIVLQTFPVIFLGKGGH